jgi:uncharacterized membrane protein
MGDANARSTNKPGAQPIHPMLVPFPIARFAGAFVTDRRLCYARSGRGARVSATTKPRPACQ